MDGSEVISVSIQDGSGIGHHHNAVVTQAVLDQLQQQVQVAQQQQQHQQQQQQQQHIHQDLILATTTVSNSTNAVTIQEPQRGIEMVEFFRKQRIRDKFCDVVLHVHGKHFYAHRMVLAAGSAYFDSIFKSKKMIRENLAVNCQDPEIFQMFLNYFYTGSITLDKNNVGELIRLSNHFLVVKLKAYCAEFLERFLDAENCLHVKQIGERFRIPSLTKAAITYVQNNLGEVINHEIMMELPPKQIENFVTEKAFGVPQDAAVKFMSRWVCHDLSTRERDFKQLLTNIDWTTIDATVIVDYIDQEPLYGSSERCFYYVLHSLAEKLIHIQKYEQMYQALQQRFGQEMDPALGFGDNLLQMAFNSAMEGLTDSTSLLMGDGRDNPKWVHGDSAKPKEQRTKLSPSLEQRRRKILTRIHRNRGLQRWVRLLKYKPRRALRYNEVIDDSSGDEECDPIQTAQGYRCHLCPFSTKKVSRLERHLSNIHAHDVTYRCSECGFMCKWNRDYFLHMKSHYDGPPFKCQICDYHCQKIGSLIAHKVTHVDLKPYQCCDCSYKCRNKANLAAHMKCHNNEKPYRCSVCGRTFASKNALDQHATTHNSEKIYSCSLCQFTTKFLNHFTNHKKTHQGTSSAPTAAKKNSSKSGEVYRCPDSQCKYTTTKKSQLDSHMRSHAGVRPHVCTICGRRFLEKSHLVRHERIHFNERPFKCEECDYASTRRDKLKEHKSRHHGLNASAKSPYKPRPHKGSSKSSSASGETVVYAKKSTVPQAQQQPIPTLTPGTVQQQTQNQSAAVATTTAAGDLEFIIPHTRVGKSGGVQSLPATTFAQLVGNQGSIDLQQLASSGVVLRPFLAGKSSEIQVAQTLASIPTSMSSADLHRTLGVKLEDLQGLQAQGILGGRAIKLEELATGGAPQVPGLGPGARISTMVLDGGQLQQLEATTATVNTTGFGRMATNAVPTTSSSTTQQQNSSTSNNQNNQTGEFSGISTLLY